MMPGFSSCAINLDNPYMINPPPMGGYGGEMYGSGGSGLSGSAIPPSFSGSGSYQGGPYGYGYGYIPPPHGYSYNSTGSV